MTQSNTPHLPKLDSLVCIRIFACLEIFCCHCLWPGGACGVSLFIILSGFLLTYNYIDSPKFPCSSEHFGITSFRFAKRKISKLYPLHIIMMCIMVIVLLFNWYTHGYTEWRSLFIQIFSHVFLLQTWIPIQSFYFSLNGLSWYLSMIFFAYLCFPLILRGLRKLRTRKAAIQLALTIYILQLLIAILCKFCLKTDDTTYYYITYVCPLFRLGDFIFGCTVGLIFSRRSKEKINRKTYTSLVMLGIFMIAIAQYLYRTNLLFSWAKYSILFTLISGFVIYMIACDQNVFSKLGKNKWVIKFSDLTPYIFLVHHQIIFAVENSLKLLGLPENKIVIAFLSMAFSLIVSSLYCKLIQTIPGLTRKKQITIKKIA